MSTERTIRWGIVGPGAIAEHFVRHFPAEDGCEILAVAGRTPAHTEDFAARHNIPRVYGTDAELAADPDVDVVYVATPTSAHVPNIKACLAAGMRDAGFKPYIETRGNQQFFWVTPEQAEALASTCGCETQTVEDPTGAGRIVVRFVTSWACSEAEVDEAVAFAASLVA